jgi:hypothetical protein
VTSLARQYEERGGLSKRQLEGLYQKCQKVPGIPEKWLATMQAEILKKPLKYKSQKPENRPLYEQDAAVGDKIAAILARYPAHKRVSFLQAKFQNNEALTPPELTDLERFFKILVVDKQ